ncbi:MAG: hypothetical protein K2J78_13085 [Muribaculaceae bacterium]|nr:hypothetical protein [Muribaculaceae bacterium]
MANNNSLDRFMYRFVKWLTTFIFIIALVVIVILLSDCRPFNSNFSTSTVNRINDSLLALSCGYIASFVFFLVQDFLPNYRKRESDKAYIRSQIGIITRRLREEIQRLFYFAIPENKNPTIEEYIEKFINDDLFTPRKELTGKSVYEELKEKDKEIKEISKELLRLYGNDLTYDQLKQLEYLTVNFDINPKLSSEMEELNGEVRKDKLFFKHQAIIIYKAYDIMSHKRFKVPHYPIEDMVDAETKERLPE